MVTAMEQAEFNTWFKNIRNATKTDKHNLDKFMDIATMIQTSLEKYYMEDEKFNSFLYNVLRYATVIVKTEISFDVKRDAHTMLSYLAKACNPQAEIKAKIISLCEYILTVPDKKDVHPMAEHLKDAFSQIVIEIIDDEESRRGSDHDVRRGSKRSRESQHDDDDRRSDRGYDRGRSKRRRGDDHARDEHYDDRRSEREFEEERNSATYGHEDYDMFGLDKIQEDVRHKPGENRIVSRAQNELMRNPEAMNLLANALMKTEALKQLHDRVGSMESQQQKISDSLARTTVLQNEMMAQLRDMRGTAPPPGGNSGTGITDKAEREAIIQKYSTDRRVDTVGLRGKVKDLAESLLSGEIIIPFFTKTMEKAIEARINDKTKRQNRSKAGESQVDEETEAPTAETPAAAPVPAPASAAETPAADPPAAQAADPASAPAAAQAAAPAAAQVAAPAAAPAAAQVAAPATAPAAAQVAAPGAAVAAAPAAEQATRASRPAPAAAVAADQPTRGPRPGSGAASFPLPGASRSTFGWTTARMDGPDRERALGSFGFPPMHDDRDRNHSRRRTGDDNGSSSESEVDISAYKNTTRRGQVPQGTKLRAVNPQPPNTPPTHIWVRDKNDDDASNRLVARETVQGIKYFPLARRVWPIPTTRNGPANSIWARVGTHTAWFPPEAVDVRKDPIDERP